ncbi:MAG TPA: Rieske 2Fe-2S domain-containing protein [Acidimicrobiales bacterium]|nr:Rieske 2Fe-2S domain-containing protein [Acidimicrobiales bacterium]
MTLHDVVRRIGDVEAIDQAAGPLARVAKKVIPPGPLKDLLSGSQLGHPLHPALTDIPIGSFAAATVLDLVGGRRSRDAVRALLAVGIVATVPTATAGLADWSDTYGSEQRIGLVHALSNVAALSLFAGSLAARRSGRTPLGRALSLAGMTTLATGGYLGGHLTYSRGVGVNNAFYQPEPEDWTAVMDAADLQAGSPTKVEADGAPVLLYRASDRIYAIGSRCSHAGGPLQEGKIDDGALCVQCPWHGSVFRLEDGTVVHGPASIPQAAYDVRVQDGRIQIRARR